MAASSSRSAWVHRDCGGPDFFLGTFGSLGDGKIERQKAVENIARRYLEWVKVFESTAQAQRC